MNHQEVLWVLQAGIEALKALGPVALLALLTWRLAR
jgi:hypothetical protein